MTVDSNIRAILIDSLSDLARAREFAVSTVEIPKPRPASDFCPRCAGTLRNHRAWISLTARCDLDWHYDS